MKNKRILIKKFFEETRFVKSNIDSYNSFIDWRMQKVINAEKELMPAVIPVDAEEVKFEFGELTLRKPIIVEADGAERPLYPGEARMRNLTYSAPVFLEIALIVDGKERDRAEVKIAEIPVMVNSKLCYLSGLTQDELITAGEDPMDPGGYFIVNGTERALVLLEDLAPNQINVSKEKTGPVTHTAKVFSSIDTYKISHAVERTKEGIFQISFSNVKKVPFTVLMKALGMLKDKDIADAVGFEELPEDLYVNLIEFMSVTNQEEAKEFISKTLQLALPKERKLQKIESILDSIFLPHLGTDKKARLNKASRIALPVGIIGAVWVIFRGDPAALLSLNIGLGDGIFFMGTVAMGFYGPLIKHLHRVEPMAQMTFWTLVSGAVWLLFLSAPHLFDVVWTAVPMAVYGGIAYLSIFTTLVTFFVFQWSATVIGPTKVMSFTYLNPALVVFLGAALGGELPPPAIFPGLFLTLLATLILQR